MKLSSLKTAAAATLLAGAIVLAPTVAANASYAPTPPASITVTAGGTFTVTFTGFAPNEPVSFTLTGEFAASATLAQVKTAVETANLGTRNADAAGSVSPTVTLPRNASGVYTLTATGANSATTSNTTITVTAAGGSGTLPATGSDSSELLGLWIGGGALLLAGGAVAVGATVRNTRKQNA